MKPRIYDTSGYGVASMTCRHYRQTLVRLCLDQLAKLKFDAIAVRGLSGVSFGSIIADRLDCDLVVVRKEEDMQLHTSHANRQVEGPTGEFSYVIIDDFVASGGTLRQIRDRMWYSRPNAKCVGVYLYEVDGNATQDPHSRTAEIVRGIFPDVPLINECRKPTMPSCLNP
jgi:adenine/guanine phosphoribosyltransferase-like PRPP-binding protein